MQLVTCEEPGCLQPEHWDGKFETAKHYQDYHRSTVGAADPLPVQDWAMYPDGTFEQEFAVIFQETFDLLVARQKKYGKHNIEQQGLLGVFTRMNDDKMNRIRRVLQGRVIDGRIVLDPIEDAEEQDTFEDALKDVANYALIMLALYRGVWGKPLIEELTDD